MTPSELPAELVSHPLEIAVRRLADDLRYGQDASPYVASGIDFVQSRPYIDGDSIKDVDCASPRGWDACSSNNTRA